MIFNKKIEPKHILIIGDSGSGKTTLLRQSELWFSDEAVFSELKNNRLPQKLLLTRILVAINSESILLTNPDTLNHKALLLREQLNQINQALGYLFPVSLIFTHSDKIPGFTDYFSHLPELIHLYLNHQDAIIPGLEHQMAIIHDNLYALLIPQIIPHNTKTSILALLNFPDNFKILADKIVIFTTILLKNSAVKNQEPPLIDHMSFTSSTTTQNLIKPLLNNTGNVKYKTIRHTLKYTYLKYLAIIVSLLFCTGLLIMYTQSYRLNQTVLNQGASIFKTVLLNKNNINNLIFYITKKNNSFLYTGLGLYKKDKLDAIFENWLIPELDHIVLPTLARSLENQLAYYQQQWATNTADNNESIRGYYYSALTLYLMLCHPTNTDPVFARNISLLLNLPFNPDLIYFYATHITHPWPEKTALVSLSHAQLYSSHNTANLYAELKIRDIYQQGFISAQAIAGNLFTHQPTLPVFFSFSVNPTIKQKMINHHFMQLYLLDYKKNWCIFLNQFRLKPFHSFNQGAHTLQLLTQKNSPLLKTLNTASDNLHFERLDLSDYYKNITILQQQLANLAISNNPGHDAQAISPEFFKPALISINKTLESISDPMIKHSLKILLLNPLQATWRIIVNQSAFEIKNKWQRRIMPFYHNHIEPKFPFCKSGDDVDLNDFNYFFNPNTGLLTNFIKKNIMPYENPFLDVRIKFSPLFLQSLSQAQAISHAFFENSDSPHIIVKAYFYPCHNIKEIKLTSNNQSLRYQNDPQEWQTFSWPGNPTNTDLNSNVVIITANNNQGSIETTGIWGFFRLLAKATLSDDQNVITQAIFLLPVNNQSHYKIKIDFNIPTILSIHLLPNQILDLN